MKFKVFWDYDLTEEERQAVLQVLQGDVFVSPKQVPAFEQEFAEYIGTKYAVATNSGTSALHCCLVSLGVSQGDEVITAANQHTAPSYMIMLCGAKPVYVDCEIDTFNIDPTEIEAAITPKTKAIVPCHSGGHPYDCDPINDIAEKHGIPVVEDAAQSLGAKYKGKLVGNFASLAMFSGARHKHIMGAGAGGIAVTNDEELAEKLRIARTSRYYKPPESDDTITEDLKKQGGAPGFSYYLSEVHAAIMRVQLKKFINPNGSLNLKHKRHNAEQYKELLADTPVTTPIEKDYAYHSYLRYMIKAPNRDKLYAFLMREKGIECFLHYPTPLPRSHFYLEAFGTPNRKFPNTEKIAKEVLTIPGWPGLSAEHRQYVVDSIKEFYAK